MRSCSRFALPLILAVAVLTGFPAARLSAHLSAPPSAPPSAWGATAEDRSIVVFPTPQDSAIRNKVTGTIELWTSDSNLSVGRASARETAALEQLGIRVTPIADPGDAELHIAALPGAGPGTLAALDALVWRHATIESSSLVSLKEGATLADLDRLLHTSPAVRPHHPRIPVPRRPSLPVRYEALPSPPTWDARVQGMIDQIDKNSIEDTIDHLSNVYYTRVAFKPEAFQARDWMVATFQSFGLSVTTHDYNSDSDNVIAELPGLSEPDKIVIVGAHYDSVNWYSYPDGRAPGADDNASGTAAVLELARILSNYSFKYTLRFVPFCSEEMGIVGSRAYAALLRSQGADVVAMLNTDMNAYRASGDTRSIDFVTDYSASWLIDFGKEVINIYLPGVPTNSGPLGGGTSDHQSFTEQGYSAVFYFEDIYQYSPYIHTSSDTLGTSANDLTRSEYITKAICGALAHLAGPVDLTIQHTPIADQQSSAGPYVLMAQASSLIGTTVTGVSVFYTQGTTFTEAPMVATGNPDEWMGQIPGQSPGTVRYYLLATDDQGYQEWLPDGTSPGETTFEFAVGIRNSLFTDDFETDKGWTHGGTTQDDWQRGLPRGKSTDPSSAYSGVNAWANDLGASGWDGEYENYANNWLESPGISTIGQTGVHLQYRRWLGVEQGIYDQAILKVAGVKVWENAANSDHIDTDWALHNLDVSTQADNKASVKIRLELKADGGLTYGGWNIDDVELYNLSQGPEPELKLDWAYVSLTAGGTITYTINLGAAYAGRQYVVLAGISGTEPGFDLNYDHVPLNFDAVTALFVKLLGVLPGWQGTLDGQGRSTATLGFPAGSDPGLAGIRLYTVAITLLPTTDNATNAVDVLLLP
ncbi:MAG: M20/M25/M40 family metallo-hydrolase [Planctomycetota bacterium]